MTPFDCGYGATRSSPAGLGRAPLTCAAGRVSMAQILAEAGWACRVDLPRPAAGGNHPKARPRGRCAGGGSRMKFGIADPAGVICVGPGGYFGFKSQQPI